MNFSRLARNLDKAARISRDINAVRRGRVTERLTNRITGRLIRKATRGLWR